MLQTDLFLLFTAPLDRAGIRYMVSGSVATIIYGEPRLTNDIDMIVEIGPAAVAQLLRLFPEDEFYCPPAEVIVIESRRLNRGHFNIIHHDTGHKADFYMPGSDALQAWALERRRWVDLADDGGLWIAPPEYVIVMKLAFLREGGSNKHVVDLRNMWSQMRDSVDAVALAEWLGARQLTDLWEQVRG